MKVIITGSTSQISVACMWYEKHIGEVFEVEVDPKYDDMYKTIQPIYKEHQGHIKKIDCIEVLDVSPQAIDSTAPAQAEGRIITEDMVNGNDCRNGQC